MHGDEVMDKIYPPIVDPEIFAKVRAKVSCNKIGKHSNAVVYLLRQKMKCGYCGENMSGECGTSKQGVRTYYYKCHGRKNLRSQLQTKSNANFSLFTTTHHQKKPKLSREKKKILQAYNEKEPTCRADFSA